MPNNRERGSESYSSIDNFVQKQMNIYTKDLTTIPQPRKSVQKFSRKKKWRISRDEPRFFNNLLLIDKLHRSVQIIFRITVGILWAATHAVNFRFQKQWSRQNIVYPRYRNRHIKKRNLRFENRSPLVVVGLDRGRVVDRRADEAVIK